MSRLWAWITRHPSLVKAASGGLAIVLLAAGLAAGIHQASRTRSSAEAGLERQPLVAHVPASRHSVVGVVRVVRPGGFVVRSQRGVFYLVRWDADSRFRAGGRAIRPAALRAGDHVLIVGSPAADGTLHATVVTITARPGGAAPAATPPSGAGSTSRPAVPIGSLTAPQ